MLPDKEFAPELPLDRKLSQSYSKIVIDAGRPGNAQNDLK